MKFACYTQDLLDDLKNVAKCADPKPMTPPILSAVKITADDERKRLVLEATNFKVAAQAVIPANIEVGGTVCVNARYLLEVVGKLTDDVVTFTLEGNSLRVDCGGSKFNLLTFDAKEFPTPKFAEEPELNVRAATLKDMISKTIFAVEKTDNSRPVFKGVNFQAKRADNGYVFQAYATNTHRIACYLGGRISANDSNVDGFNVVIPPDFLRMINAAIDNNPDNFIYIIPEDQKVTFKFDNVRYSTRIIEGEFPPVDRLLYDDNRTNTATFYTKELKAALEQAKLVAKNAEYNQVILRLSENKIEVTADSRDHGNFSKNVEAKCSAELEISFNVDYLLDFLGAAACTKIRMKYGDNVTPIEMSDIDIPDEYIYIVTPVRI